MSIRRDYRLSATRTSIRRDSRLFILEKLSICQLEEIIVIKWKWLSIFQFETTIDYRKLEHQLEETVTFSIGRNYRCVNWKRLLICRLEVTIDISVRRHYRLSVIRTSIRRDCRFFNWKKLSICQLEEIIDLSVGREYRLSSVRIDHRHVRWNRLSIH